MNILDIFSFKKSFQEVVTTENIASLREVAKNAIIKQIKSKIKGDKKMDKVVDTIVAWVQEHIHSKNSIVQWIIDNVLIPNVRLIAQAIYDDLKERIENL